MDINLIQTQVENDLTGVASLQELEVMRVKYLGRKGVLAELTGLIGTLAAEERGSFGKEVNALKNKLLNFIDEKEKTLRIQGEVTRESILDIGLPGIAQDFGGSHPITQVIDEICGIFNRMGFSIVEGPEIETV